MPRRLHAWLIVLPALLFALLAPAQAQPLADPRVDWFSADSANFRVHYRAGQRAQAERVALAAEAVFPRVTRALQWVPRTRTEIVLYNEYDIANGFSTPLPYNFIGVFLTPPDDGELLDNNAWLDLLLVHEFTHAVHLDKVRGGPRILQLIFGNVPWFIPNLFMPGWGVEGLAVFNESDPAVGRGRLKGPYFEAWLRAERTRGFMSLREINADGRSLPLNKQYLYGAYFMEFLNRRYGDKAIGAFVEQYSGNIIVPRLHSAPWGATGKMMDELWDEFLADLAQQVDERAAAIKAMPEAVGAAMAGPLFEIENVAALPGEQGWLAVVSDGLNGTHLMRIKRDGSRERVTRVNGGARLSVAADGGVLLTQPDICNTLYYGYDVYRLKGSSLDQLTSCGHYKRAVAAGGGIVAIELKDCATRLVLLDAQGGSPKPVYTPEAGQELLDLAAAPDGRSVSVIQRKSNDWRVLQLDPLQPTPRLLVRRGTPMQGLRHGAAGIEFVMADAAQGSAPNVWRLAGTELQRITHSHTAVLHHAGSAADGQLASVVIAPRGATLHRLPQPAVLQTVAAVTEPATLPPLPAAPEGTGLKAERGYSALRALYPRSWLPAITADRGLTAYGASTSGGDALGWHQWAALVQAETSQNELIGSLQYVFVGSHSLALTRELTARAWTTSKKKDTTTVYDRSTQAQWLSLFPFSKLERRIHLGVGAAAAIVDRVNVPADASTRREDERLAAALIDVDFSNGDWYSEGPNRGAQGTLLLESYKPFEGGKAIRYDGTVARADLRAYLPISRAVLALRYTEARARGRTEPFQLGGATDQVLQFGPTLNDRELSLRGYRGDEPGLRGQNARVATVELRTPISDIDRHFMVPALGINRLSLAVFFDIGGAWSTGNGPAELSRGVGVEVLGEVKLLYALGLRLRLGVASALDAPKGTRGWLTFGRSF